MPSGARVTRRSHSHATKPSTGRAAYCESYCSDDQASLLGHLLRRHDVRDPKGEDRSEDVSCPARPSAQELRELVSTRAYTLTRVALPLVGCGGPLERKHAATKLPSIISVC